jgi:hypothetical protein
MERKTHTKTYANDSETSSSTDTRLTQLRSRKVRKALHRERRALRGDQTRYEAIRLLLDMQKHGAAPAFMARQMRIVNRVRVQSVGSKI